MEQAIFNFERLTRFPLLKYFDDVEKFFKESYPLLFDYFKGQIDQIKQIHIRRLAELKQSADDLSIQFKNNRAKLQTVDFWELIVFCEDIRTRIETTMKLSKYLRSSRTNFNYSNSFNFPYTTGTYETLEDISNNVLQDAEPNDDWASIALKNDLLETDYDPDGGKSLTLFKERFVGGFVQSVIDNMIGEKIYGLDLDKKLTFENNDLKVLSYKDTVYQCVAILSLLKRGDVPEHFSFGINAALYTGSNIKSLLLRQAIIDLKSNFQSDDLFQELKVTNISYDNGDFKVEFEVATKYDLFVKSSTVI